MVRFRMLNGKANSEVYNLINKEKLDVVAQHNSKSDKSKLSGEELKEE